MLSLICAIIMAVGVGLFVFFTATLVAACVLHRKQQEVLGEEDADFWLGFDQGRADAAKVMVHRPEPTSRPSNSKKSKTSYEYGYEQGRASTPCTVKE